MPAAGDCPIVCATNRRYPLNRSPTPRLAQAALGHEPVGEQEQRLVRRRAEAELGVRRVRRVLAIGADRHPSGVATSLEPDEPLVVTVREQARAAAALR